MMSEAFIYDVLRTPRAKGRSSGAFYELKPIDLLARILQALQERNALDTSLVGDVILGCVAPVNDQGFNIARAAIMQAGWADSAAGMQINRYCASGLESVNLAAMKVRSGWDELIVAGGTESMSRVPLGSDGGALLHDPEVISRLNYVPQGISADLLATLGGFSRQAVDEYALQSQQRAAQASKQGYFSASLIPIHDQNGLLLLDQDELIRPNTQLEILSQLPPAFASLGRMGFDEMALHKYPAVEKVIHVHTAGNSSGFADGAALVLVGSAAAGTALGLKPRARIRAVSNVGVEPTLMLTGPVPAARQALQRAGMQVSDIDLWECNEAFASVVLHFMQELSLDPAIVNVNGGAIALGHPLGATGAMLLGTLLDELERRALQTGLVTLCAGGGMGVATIIERL